MLLWFTFSYAPIAHMVWFWAGPDAYTDPKLVDELNSKAGLIWQWGALDFAGGTVVHINAGIAGLVGAYVMGKRVGYGKEAMSPHNLTMTMIGASLLLFGVHAVGGILGALLTGVFCDPSLGGPGFVADWVTASVVKPADYSIGGQVWTQAKAVGVTVIWSAVVAFICYKIADVLVGLRVTEEEEREGLDINSHGETAYHM